MTVALSRQPVVTRRHRRPAIPLLAVLAVAFVAFISIAPARAAGDAAAGKALAQIWCSGCHIVDPTGGATKGGADSAPPFAEIAHRYGADHVWLHAWLTAPHPPMPNLTLSRAEMDDVIAYLDSLPSR